MFLLFWLCRFVLLVLLKQNRCKQAAGQPFYFWALNLAVRMCSRWRCILEGWIFIEISSIGQLTFLSLPPKILEKTPLQTSLQKFINPVTSEKSAFPCRYRRIYKNSSFAGSSWGVWLLKSRNFYCFASARSCVPSFQSFGVRFKVVIPEIIIKFGFFPSQFVENYINVGDYLRQPFKSVDGRGRVG